MASTDIRPFVILKQGKSEIYNIEEELKTVTLVNNVSSSSPPCLILNAVAPDDSDVEPLSLPSTGPNQDLSSDIWSISRCSRFVPTSQLVRILNINAVKMELSKKDGRDTLPSRALKKLLLKASSNDKIKQAQAICQPTGGLRKILGTLLLMSPPQADAITDFIDEKLCDDHLPFEKVIDENHNNQVSLRPYSKNKTSPRPIIQLFRGKDWPARKIDEFEEKQWVMLAPVFPTKSLKDGKVQEFDAQTILPFTFSESECRGGNGEIFKVKIHPEYHNFSDPDDGQDPVSHHGTRHEFFAVKQIAEEKGFSQEVRILKRVIHPHIITLLDAYRYGAHFHLILPWAECNLATYWEKRKPNPSKDWITLLWVARQCNGIAEGLSRLHCHATSTGSSLLAREIMVPPTWSPQVQIGQSHPPIKTGAPRHQVFGRHGDIKPMNLLWFPGSPHDPYNHMGIIKISDFGEGVFSLTQRSWCETDSISYTPCYRPPECDSPNQMTQISNTYDTWTLGCLFLEFVTWYMGGWTMVSQFGKLRNGPFFQPLPQQQRVVEESSTLAEIKPTVVNHFRSLEEDAATLGDYSNFVIQILALIKNHMLVIEPHSSSDDHGRYSCQNISRELGKAIQDSNLARHIEFAEMVAKRLVGD